MIGVGIAVSVGGSGLGLGSESPPMFAVAEPRGPTHNWADSNCRVVPGTQVL